MFSSAQSADASAPPMAHPRVSPTRQPSNATLEGTTTTTPSTFSTTPFARRWVSTHAPTQPAPYSPIVFLLLKKITTAIFVLSTRKLLPLFYTTAPLQPPLHTQPPHQPCYLPNQPSNLPVQASHLGTKPSAKPTSSHATIPPTSTTLGTKASLSYRPITNTILLNSAPLGAALRANATPPSSKQS